MKDFTYHFKPNRVYALMGANGSGKTTLFHLISGFLKADEGEIYLKDENITTFEPHRIAKIGLSRTFQDMRLIPTHTKADKKSRKLSRPCKHKKVKKSLSAHEVQSRELQSTF